MQHLGRKEMEYQKTRMANLKVYHIPASLYTLEDSKTFTAKGSFQHLCQETCYISFHLPVPSRNKDFCASLYFTADLKYGTMTTNILTLQLIFEIYCMPGTSLSVLESLILKTIL